MTPVHKILLLMLTLLPLCAAAQGDWIRKGDCLPPADGEAATLRAKDVRRLPTPRTSWDASKTYKQLVILVSFKDCDFSREDPLGDYDKIFNQPGYNEGLGAGCVADYYRDQSGGRFNMSCDVFGPFKVDTLAQPYDKPTSSTKNYGRAAMERATRMMIEANPSHDFKQYDWNGDGKIEQVIYVFAGYGGNQSSEKAYGYVWPNTSSFSTITTPDGMKISSYTVSAELWTNNRSCGIGTICHEYSHGLGLPDIYPTNDTAYSTCDEWDLMDGGNFVNLGWCPPNYSPYEKLLLGWLNPIELTERTTVTDLQSVSEGGAVYRISHTANEYLLLENRQWTGWDAGLPGKGLTIWHINHSDSKRSSNTVNNTPSALGCQLVHADNLDYTAWAALTTPGKHQNKPYMNSMMLSTSPYPWSTDSTTFVNDALTDTSVPATLMINANANGQKLLSKPITHIKVSDDGLVSFDFLIKGDVNGDGKVNGSDIQAIINMIVNELSFEECINGDVNGDGKVNGADIQSVINIIIEE